MSEELKKSILSKSIDHDQLDQIAGGDMELPCDAECAHVSKRNDCHATVEFGSWCWSNDACGVWEYVYEGCLAETVDLDL